MKDITNFNKLGDFLTQAAQCFADADLYYGHGTDNPWDEAVAIALFVLDLPANIDNSALDIKLDTKDAEKFIGIVKERIKTKKPLPYLINQAWFGGEKYYVDERVIVPRSPFAEVILKGFYLDNFKPNNILELCTGSGCIAIMASKYYPAASIDAGEISTLAIAVANKNVELHNATNVTIIESDLFQNIPDKKYDLIISNPPYIGISEKQDLPKEYQHEPELALYADDAGLKLTKDIIYSAQDYLLESGYLIIEVGYNWDLLEAAYPDFKFNWLEFENGGEGLFMMSYHDITKFKERYARK